MTVAGPLGLRPEQAMFLEVVEQIARDRVAPVAEGIDAHGRLDADALELLRESQVLTAGLSEEQGGAGTDPFLGVLVVEHIAMASASLAVPVLMAHGCGYAVELGRDGARSVGRSVEDGGIPVLASGRPLAIVRTAGVDGPLRVEGAVASVPLVQISDAMFLPGWDEAAGEACLLTIDSCDVELEDPCGRTGLHGADVRDIKVSLELGPDAIVGGKASLQAAENWLLLGWAAVAAGVARAAITEAAAYMQERQQFGQPLAQFAALRQLLASAESRVGAVTSQLHAVAQREDVLKRSAGAACAAVAQTAAEVAVAVTIDAVQLHGGYGYVREYAVERLMRDAISVRARIGGSRTAGVQVADALLGAAA